MNKVKCFSCAWRVKQPDYDGSRENCSACNNTRLVQDPAEILCSNCAGYMCPVDPQNSAEFLSQIPHGLSNVEVFGSYFSEHMTDMTKYKFNLCEKCIRNMFSKFKIKPHTYDMFSAPLSYDKDQEYYDYIEWSKCGGKKDAYEEGLCNAVKNCANKAIYSHFYESKFTIECSCEEHKPEIYPFSQIEIKPFISNKLNKFI